MSSWFSTTKMRSGRSGARAARMERVHGARAVERQLDREGGALVAAAARGDQRAVVRLDRRLGDRQAEAEAAELARHPRPFLREGVEDRRQRLARDADAGVGDDQHEAVVDVARHDLDLAFVGRELGGVLEQVPDHLLQARSVARDDGGAARAAPGRGAGAWRRSRRRRRRRRRARPRACRSASRLISSLPLEMRVTSSRSSISISSARDVPADQLDRAAQRRPAARRCARARAAPSPPASAACAARARGWRGSGPWRGSPPRPRRAPCGCRPAPAPARRGWSRAPARRRAPASGRGRS